MQRRLHWLPMFEEFCGVQRRLHWLPCLWRFAGVQRRLYLRRLRDLRGAVWTTVLATPVELYMYILMRRMRGAENSYVLSSHCLSLYGAIGI